MIETSRYLSVIIPVYNEEESIQLLHTHLRQVLQNQDFSSEIIYVDDGSTDRSFEELTRLLDDPSVQIVRLRRNFGQTAAIAAGVANSRGKIVVCMDADLQNDPLDIPRLLEKIGEGYDVVSGWRKNRRDALLSRKFPSWLANRLISIVTGVHLHDYGCTLKAYRREVLQHIRLYGEMHRFIPAYAALAGASITEIEVLHHPRRFGMSKYGISRTVRVLFDLLTLKFLGSFGTKPLYAFGMPGLFSVGTGSLLCAGVLSQKVLPPHVRVHRNPLLSLAILFSGLGVQFIMMGLLAELLTRTYYESQGKGIYVVRAIHPPRQADAAKPGAGTGAVPVANL